MVVSKKPKAIVYIDGANMFYTQKKLGWFFDWQKVKQYLEGEYQVLDLRFYASFKKDKGGDQRFLALIKKLGFKTISKPLKLIEDQFTGKILPKANFDVEITRDILYEILRPKKSFKVFCLFSGDSDFSSLIWDLEKKFNKKVHVYSSRQTLSWEVRLAASKHFYFENLKQVFFRKNWDLTKKIKSGIKNLSCRRTRKRVRFLLTKRVKSDTKIIR